jgi:cystathionine beta-lyase
MKLSQTLFHTGEERERYFNAIAPPVMTSSNYAFPTVAAFREALINPMDTHVYTRGNNPTVEILRRKMAELCGTEEALAFATGSGALAAAILSCVNTGDHIISVQKPYAFTQVILDGFLQRFGVERTYVDARGVEEIEKVIQPNTKLLFLESPNSMTFELQDLKACSELARDHGILTCIDNSCATPIFQRAADFGIDLVVHAGTKYLNGHSDATCGIVCGSRKHLEKLYSHEFMALGGVLSPQDAALVIRGLRTLELRMQRSDASARQLAKRLEQHAKVQQVLFPFLPSFPQYELARKQMKGAGGLFSILLDTDDIREVDAFTDRLERFSMAVSWGGHESLVLPNALFHQVPGRTDSPLPFQLVRFYIGLEDPRWLWEDIQSSLEKMG